MTVSKSPGSRGPGSSRGSGSSSESVPATTPPGNACISCGQPASFKSPTGHPVCAQCANTGPTFSDLLDDISAFITRFVVFTTDHQLVASVLWAAHTHITARIRTSPYLHVSSPEPASGKSQLLDVLELLVHNPWSTVLPSPAVLYRKIDQATNEQGGLTLLLDEVDPIWKGADESAQALRGVLNAGYQKGRVIPRCVGPSQKIVDFHPYCAKALAGLGDLPDTLKSRSIRIAMKRRKPSESVSPLFPDEVADEATTLRQRLADQVAAVDLAPVKAIRRELLEIGLSDRAADGWANLVAIADHAGGSWLSWSRDAAEHLGRVTEGDAASLGLQLLGDVRDVWTGDRMFSADLVARLHDLDESPWGDFFGKPITQHKVGRYLAQFDVKSKQIRIGDDSRKGYLLPDLVDAWDRYLPSVSPYPPIQTETRNTPGQSDISDVPNDGVSLSESAISSMVTGDVSLVSLSPGVNGTREAKQDDFDTVVQNFEAAGFDIEELRGGK